MLIPLIKIEISADGDDVSTSMISIVGDVACGSTVSPIVFVSSNLCGKCDMGFSCVEVRPFCVLD